MGGCWQASILSRGIEGLGANPSRRRIKPLERQTRDTVLPVKRLGPLASRLLSIVADVRQTASSNLLIILVSFGASVLAARLLGPEQRGALAAAVVYVTLASAIADAGLNQAVPYLRGKAQAGRCGSARHHVRAGVASRRRSGRSRLRVTGLLSRRFAWSAVLPSERSIQSVDHSSRGVHVRRRHADAVQHRSCLAVGVVARGADGCGFAGAAGRDGGLDRGRSAERGAHRGRGAHARPLRAVPRVDDCRRGLRQGCCAMPCKAIWATFAGCSTHDSTSW